MPARSTEPIPSSGGAVPGIGPSGSAAVVLHKTEGGPAAATSVEPVVPPRPTVDVTAVLVAHNGERWLPEVLAALAASTVVPRRTIAVDTGSSDTTGELLAAATGHCLDRVVTVGRRVGYGAAVAAGLAAEADASGGASAWLWLLHDDSAFAPDVLAELLEHAGRHPSVALLGPKVRDWSDPRLLVEVGLTIDRAGHRETGLERREYDQGQHDAVRDVLAVGTAGALVRREVWDALGGLDPALPVFRDDLDLGWRVNAAGHGVVVVPDAIVRHVRAATTGLRRLHATRGRPEGIDRRHALLVLLAHASALRLPVLVARLVVATVVRVLGFLLTRQPLQAVDELAAAGSVLLRPRRLRAARRLRARTRVLPPSALRSLFASRRGRARARAEAFAEWLGGRARGPASGRLDGLGSPAGLGGLGDVGPDGSDEFDDDVADSGGLLRRLLVRPPVLLVLVLLAVALLAERSVLSTSGGVLAGGRLLPAPGGARDLWAAYAASWHSVSVGTDAPAPPMLAVLALLSTVLLGKAWLAVDVLLLGSIPLAGAAAYAATRSFLRPLPLRLWAAATWALLPVATGAVAAGRLDAAVAQVGLPLLLPAGARLLHADPAAVGWRHAWAAGLGLALLAAFAPTLWPLLAALLLVGTLLRLLRDRPAVAVRRAGAVVITLGTSVLLLLPWSATLLSPAGKLLFGPGRVVRDPALAAAALPAWHLPLLSPGGAGLPPVWVTAGLVLAALAGALRRRRRALALGGWALALAGLAGAVLLARLTPAVPGSSMDAPAWPGTALQVSAAGLLLAALVAADGIRGRLITADFGWRQLTAGSFALLAALLPLLAAGSFAQRGVDGPLRRGDADTLPAFVRSELRTEPGLRVLVLRPEGGRVGYTLEDADGVRLGAADLPPESRQVRLLDAVVGDLLARTGSDAAAALATRAVRYVALPVDAAGSGELVDALDAQPGLVRRARGSVQLWQVTAPTARLSLLAPELAQTALSGDRAPDPDLVGSAAPQALPDRSQVLPAGPPGRLLVLSEANDASWTATVDGQVLPHRTAWGWAAAYLVPQQGGALRLSHTQSGRRTVLVLQGLGLLVVAVLAGPGVTRRSGLELEDRPRHARTVSA